MTDLLFWGFILLLGYALVGVLGKPEKIYEYPYFMAATFAIFILPQAVSLHRFPGPAPEQAVQAAFLMSGLCLAVCLVGHRLFASRPLRSCIPVTVDEGRLFHGGLAFVACGIGFSYVLSHTEVQTSEMGGWTGPATIYGFFQQLCYPGFAICLTLALRRPTLTLLSATLLACIVPVQSLIYGRREPAALFALTIGLTLYFQMRLRPARWLMLILIIAAALAIPATATYRRFQIQNDWESVRQIDPVENFKEFLNQESVLELRNAAMLIEATRRSRDYQCGAGYWNHLVFRYVPAQLLGQNFKQSLMLHSLSDGVERELAGMDYVNPAGSTVTGMGDAFQQFGYWGCLFFAGLAVFFQRLWRAAMHPRALFTQLLYMQSCTCAMRALTHWTLDFLPGLLYNAIFLGAALLYAASTQKSERTDRFDRRRREPHLPNALATMKINMASPKPPPRSRYKSE
jgi:hypothetical protein